MSSLKAPKVILGAGNVGDSNVDKTAKFDSPAQVSAFLDLAHSRGLRALDTARSYSPHAPGSSEVRLGAVDAGARFSIDTKIGGPELGGPELGGAKPTALGADEAAGGEADKQDEVSDWGNSDQVHTAGKIRLSVQRSLEDLRLPEGRKIDVMFLHSPDRNTSFEVTCQAMDQAWREGKFQRFGLSNYRVDEVESIVEICKKKGFVVPSVYQGQYNPIVRSGEEALFPVLRKHGIAFYAWSPSTAGVFAGNHKVDRAGGRFDSSSFIGKLYTGFYARPGVDAAVENVKTVAAQHGLTGHAAALRWTTYHSLLDSEKGDALVVGASSCEQLSANLDIIEDGPLPKEVAEAVGAVFEQIEGDPVAYHY